MLDIERLTKIGQGMTAEIFALDDDKVAKVFFEPFCGGYADNEAHSAQAAYACGIATPKIFEVTKIASRDAIIYERLTNYNMERFLIEKPLRAKHCARQMAVLQLNIHKIVPTARIARLEDAYARAIMAKKSLTDEEKSFAVDLIRRLPPGDRLCHGDFHPQNILLHNNTPYIIDWTAGVVGNPMADLCGTCLITGTAATHQKISRLRRIGKELVLRSFVREYMKTYFAASFFTPGDMYAWLPVRAAMYMDVGLSPECEAIFMDIIRTAMRGEKCRFIFSH